MSEPRDTGQAVTIVDKTGETWVFHMSGGVWAPSAARLSATWDTGGLNPRERGLEVPFNKSKSLHLELGQKGNAEQG